MLLCDIAGPLCQLFRHHFLTISIVQAILCDYRGSCRLRTCDCGCIYTPERGPKLYRPFPDFASTFDIGLNTEEEGHCCP